MSLIGQIDKVPVYSTIEEAELWAKQYNLTGYHNHTIKGNKGYMGGSAHAEIKVAVEQGVKTFLTSQELRLGQFVTTHEEREAYRAKVVFKKTIRPVSIEIDTPETVVVPVVRTTAAGGSTSTSSSGSSGGGSGGGYSGGGY